jgi:hypothetical protein
VPPSANKWDQRIDRARELAAAYPFSAHILLFYAKLTAFQKSSYLQLQSCCGLGNGRGSSLPPALDEVDLGVLTTRFGAFVSMIACEAPASLAEFARGLNGRVPSAGAALLHSFWPGDRPAATEASGDVGASPEGPHTTLPQQRAATKVALTSTGECQSAHRKPPAGQPDHNHFERFFAQAFLQPYAEFLADHADLPTPPVRRPLCPYCGSPPLVGVLREQGDGAKRSLVCSFCRTEWDYLRLACTACEESREEKLCVYSTPEFDCVRVDACDTCRSYLQTIDLTHNGLAVPEVDELAAIPLTLWAEEKGYRKVARNILGL